MFADILEDWPKICEAFPKNTDCTEFRIYSQKRSAV